MRMRKRLAAAVAGTLIAITGNVGATMVYDPANWIQNFLQRYQSEYQNAKELVHWAEQVKHMQQQLIRLQSYMSASGLLASVKVEDIQKRGLNDGIAETCPGASPGLVASIQNLVTARPAEDLLQQQANICAQIVQLQNRQFNDTVDIMSALRSKAEQWQGLDAFRVSSTSEGQLAGSMSQVGSFMSGLEQDLAYWEVMNTAYATQISLLQQTQQNLAMQAMRGKSHAVGTIFQGVLLRGALNGN